MTDTVDVKVDCPIDRPTKCAFSLTHHYDSKIASNFNINQGDPETVKHIRDKLKAAHNAGQHERHGIRAFAGQMIRKDAEVIMIFKVKGKYYPANENNREVMDTYLHTGATAFLENLTDEVEL